MSVKATSASPQETETPAEIGKDLFLIAMPLVTYQLISDVAARRNLTFSQALQQALTNWAGSETGTSRLLMEKKEGRP